MTSVDTRERLIVAAAELFHAKGYNAVGVQEVCRAAGANKGSFYHFFDSKESLMTVVVGEGRRTPLMFDPRVFDETPALDVLLLLYAGLAAEVQAQYARSGHVQGCPIGSLVAEVATQSEPIREAASRALTHMRHMNKELVERAVREGDLDANLDAEAVAARLVAYVQGALLLSKTQNEPGVLESLRSGYLMLLGLDPNDPEAERSA
ncbi:MAG: TetR/AcrR family transcriptional regulator [Myxococcota bacterium]